MARAAGAGFRLVGRGELEPDSPATTRCTRSSGSIAPVSSTARQRRSVRHDGRRHTRAARRLGPSDRALGDPWPVTPRSQRAFYGGLFNWPIGDGPIMNIPSGLGGPEPGPAGHMSQQRPTRLRALHPGPRPRRIARDGFPTSAARSSRSRSTSPVARRSPRSKTRKATRSCSCSSDVRRERRRLSRCPRTARRERCRRRSSTRARRRRLSASNAARPAAAASAARPHLQDQPAPVVVAAGRSCEAARVAGRRPRSAPERRAP